jgi:hypothetical protein
MPPPIPHKFHSHTYLGNHASFRLAPFCSDARSLHPCIPQSILDHRGGHPDSEMRAFTQRSVKDPRRTKKARSINPGPPCKAIVSSYCTAAGPTAIGFAAAGAVGAVSPGITGVAVITPVAASVMLIPYRSSVFDSNCSSPARSLA